VSEFTPSGSSHDDEGAEVLLFPQSNRSSFVSLPVDSRPAVEAEGRPDVPAFSFGSNIDISVPDGMLIHPGVLRTVQQQLVGRMPAIEWRTDMVSLGCAVHGENEADARMSARQIASSILMLLNLSVHLTPVKLTVYSLGDSDASTPKKSTRLSLVE
jgi:hypothetical protein